MSIPRAEVLDSFRSGAMNAGLALGIGRSVTGDCVINQQSRYSGRLCIFVKDENQGNMKCRKNKCLIGSPLLEAIFE